MTATSATHGAGSINTIFSLVDGGFSALQPIDGTRDVPENILDGLLAIDVQEYSAVGVEVEQRFRLGLEHLEAMGDCHFIVVLAPLMVLSSAETIQQLVATDPEIDDGLKLDIPDLLSHRVGHLRLAERSRESVEDIATIARRLKNRREKHFDDEFVRHEITSSDVIGCNLADVRSSRNLGTQQFSARQVGYPIMRSQFRRLCTFPRTWISHQQKSHLLHPIRSTDDLVGAVALDSSPPLIDGIFVRRSLPGSDR